MAKTRVVTARTSLVFRRMGSALPAGGGATVLFQLVVKGLEAHAQDFGGARPVLPGGLEGALDQHPFGLVHGGADADRHDALIDGLRGRRLRHGKARWQVTGIERRAIDRKSVV